MSAPLEKHSLKSFSRDEMVTKAWRRKGDNYELSDVSYREAWDEEELELTECELNQVMHSGGTVITVLMDDRIVGFAALEGETFGAQSEYRILSQFHISSEYRKHGLGRDLFKAVIIEAKQKQASNQKKASKLYISASSSENTQNFYRSMGCVPALEIHAKMAEKEPYDLQLEYDLDHYQDQMIIVPMSEKSVFQAAFLANKLWPHGNFNRRLQEFMEIHHDKTQQCFICYDTGMPVGFVQASTRNDYVEGTKSSPVAYIEGIYVQQWCRRKGYSLALIEAVERWAEAKGYSELASDCELINEDSIAFHTGAGFKEANRIVCFVKSIKGDNSHDTI